MYINQREVAVSALAEITSEGAYNNIALRRALARNNALSRQDKAFVTELVNGALRNLIYLDYVIGRFSKTPTAKMKPFVLNVLRTAAYQIIFMDKTPDFAACDESVKLVKKRGLAGLAPFVNGVLRSVARNKTSLGVAESSEEGLCLKYSYPRWIIDYWSQSYGFDATAMICRRLHQASGVSIAVNTLRTDKAALMDMLRAEGVSVRGGSYLENSLIISGTSDISGLKSFQDGLFFVIDESSMLAAEVLAPRKGATILDICSAPGGKACYLAILCGDDARIRAFDIYEHKIWLIEDTLSRLGVASVTASISDATVFDPSLEEAADCVLLDAPCSGLGLIRKKPEIKYRKTMADVEELAGLQRRMLANVARYVAPGGVLVYSVCTISPRECQDVAEWFAENHPFELEPIEGAFTGKPGVSTPITGCIQILPIAEGVAADAFFIAKFRRKEVQP